MGTDGHGWTEFLAADMIHPDGEARKECFHPCLSGLIRGSILWLFRSDPRLGMDRINREIHEIHEMRGD